MSQQQELIVVDPTHLKKELNFEPTGAAFKALSPEIDAKASALALTLTSFDLSDENNKLEIKNAVETLGYQVQKESARQSEMLKQPLTTIKSRSDDGGEVANAIISLKIQVEDLDPAKFDFSAGFLTRFLGFLPGIGTPMKRYFSKFESAQTVIDAIIKSIELGRETLKRDNITLAEDQKRMRELALKLEKIIALGTSLDLKVAAKMSSGIDANDPKRIFIEEEVLFPLRQRILDLQQQLAVSQQGVLAMEIIIRNNKELIRGVDRALNVTISALQVAVTVAMALENQRIVLDKVNALTKTTDNLIANTAARLKTQGAEIHKQAAATTLNMDTLKKAFGDINAAMEEIASFRRNALPQMAQNILAMDQLNQKAEESIVKLEKAGVHSSKILLDVS